jgi:hypothetical protein
MRGIAMRRMIFSPDAAENISACLHPCYKHARKSLCGDFAPPITLSLGLISRMIR